MSTSPRKTEATGSDKIATITFRGQEFTLNREYDEWTVDLLESIEEGKVVGIVRGALDEAQFRRVREMRLKVKDLRELSDLIVKAMGFGNAGESSPSVD